MRKHKAIILAIGLALSLGPPRTSSALAADCQPNDVRGIAAPGHLMISQFAVNLDFDDCPTSGFNRQIDVSQGRPLYIWLRLEGDSKFAALAKSSSVFMIRLHRENALREHSTWLDLDNKKLAVDAVRSESSLPENNGYFDWRLYARINTYLVPGKYELSVRYGNSPVCEVAGTCKIAIDVRWK
ncbi:hypothetical protein ACU8KI_16140 [Rhizobium leguminosarum]